MGSSILCIAWYKPETYLQIKVLCEDGEKLHDTFFEWENSANALLRMAEASGKRVVRVELDPVEYSKWCASKGLKLDAASRSEYASDKGRRSMR